MGSQLLSRYFNLLDELSSYCNNTAVWRSSFYEYIDPIYWSKEQNRFSKPMPWIGMYIASASLFCVLAMVADLLHGLRNRKLWFPCKYFTLNAASLTVIAVAMKLPVDLTNPMPGHIDQDAKLGSMAFMCTMMANLLPSLATMDGKELLTNMIALNVLVITLVVNVCIQINTNVISIPDTMALSNLYGLYTSIYSSHYYSFVDSFKQIAAIYVIMLLLLLMVHASSSLAIVKSKPIIESKYQELHEAALKDRVQLGKTRVAKLKEHVRHYWIMARTGCPQFMIASFATTNASGVICALSTLLHIYLLISTIDFTSKPSKLEYDSDYKWSILFISIIQFIGVILGTIAPLSRCFASLSFKLSVKLIWNHSKVFKVESFWTQMLSDWKQSSAPSLFHSRKGKIVIQKLKIIFLNIWIGFQKTFVVAFKMISLIPFFVVIYIWCCSCCWKWLKAMFSASGIVLGQNHGQMEQNEDLRRYALQIQDDIELADRTLKGISKSLNRLIQKAEKKQPNDLMKLLAKSGDFKGVGKYDSHYVSSLTSEEYLDCWSLPLVTLTTVAISLPEIANNTIEWLVSSVSEGLVYVRLVEEALNVTDEYISTRNAAKFLWRGVEYDHEWLGISLRKLDPRQNRAGQILEWFKERAESMVNDVKNQNIRYQNDNSLYRSVSADSMYRITTTIMHSNNNNSNELSQRELYDQLLSMIADIFAACLTNLPRAIMMKCHTNVIDKRVASVHEAAQCLGETMQIINSLIDRPLPSMLNPEEMPFIDKWRACFNHPSP